MSNIAVFGGTGTAGRAIVAEAVRRGHATRAISRSGPRSEATRGAHYVQADVAEGEDLAEALEGIDVVIDAMDARTGKALKALPGASGKLLRAAELAGVQRAVLLSIAGSDQLGLGYYRAQVDRVRRFNSAQLETVVAYSTQFHQLLDAVFSAGARVGIIPAVTGARVQPIATETMAAALLDVAEGSGTGAGAGSGRHSSVSFGGPQILEMQDLARQWKVATGRWGIIARVPVFGPAGRYLSAGSNLVPENPLPGLTFRQWLEARR